MSNRTVNLFAAGGAASNIVADILKTNNTSMTAKLANLNITLLDTSRSNYERNKDIFEKHDIKLVTIPGLDGSGQKRDTNVQEASKYIAKFVSENGDKDAALNILLHSASGGSGSVLANLAAKYLLSEDKNVVAIVVGDSTTRNFANNTISTLKSYENIAQTAEKPMIADYIENDGKRTIKEVNDYIASTIIDYRMLFGGHVHGIDSADLKNFLQYNRISSNQPALTLMTTLGIDSDAKDQHEVAKALQRELNDDLPIIAYAMVSVTEKENRQIVDCDFKIEGSVDLPRDEKVKPYDLYFCLSKGHFFNVVDRLSKVVEEYRKKENTQVDRVIDVSKDVDPNSGLVL